MKEYHQQLSAERTQMPVCEIEIMAAPEEGSVQVEAEQKRKIAKMNTFVLNKVIYLIFFKQ